MKRSLSLLLILLVIPTLTHAGDLLSGFQNPSKEYSPVPIWWWSGGKIEKDRLAWQMERMVEGHVYNAVVLNLNPSSDQPTYFSPEWWNLMDFTLAKAEKLGMRIWFYDQIGFARSGICEQLMAANPSFRAESLKCSRADASGGTAVEIKLPEDARLISAIAVPGQDLDKAVDLTNAVQGGVLSWIPPAGQWQVMLFYAQPADFDFSNPVATAKLMDRTYGEYERRYARYLGNVIPGSFQDELPAMPRWSKGYLEEFEKRKGYDLTPWLPALFYDFGPETVPTIRDARSRGTKHRMDYRDVMAGMCEDAFFKPCFEWHREHGMICGTDQRDRDAAPVSAQRTYVDYFRTMRWYDAPGQDQNGDPKIRASMAHLYGRARVWQEGFHSTGWGQTLEELADLLDAFYLRGANLYDPHAWYYTTAGSWWEFAPPCTSFRQPYWKHYSCFADYVARMSFLLSRGSHVCDIGVLYPSAAIQADMTIDGKVSAASQKVNGVFWGTLTALDNDDRDYDWIDEASLQNSVLKDGRLCAGSEQYRVLILTNPPTPKAAEKIGEFAKSGGTVIEVPSPEALPEVLKPILERDWSSNVRCLHRRADGLDFYFTVRGMNAQEEVVLKARGKPEIWDPYTGKVHPIADYAITDSGTRMRLDFDLSPAFFIVIKPSDNVQAESKPGLPPSVIPLDGDWEFQLRPTMDNRWGDFRLPASRDPIPIETREFRYAEDLSDGFSLGWNKPEFDDSEWGRAVYTYGPYWLASEWINDSEQPASWQPVTYSRRFGIDHDPVFGGVRFIADKPITFGKGQSNLVKTRSGSMYGPKGRVPPEFVDLGTGPTGSVRYLSTFACSPKPQKARVRIDCLAKTQVWINGEFADGTVDLRKHWNSVRIKVFRGSGRARVSFALSGLQDEGSVAKWIWDKDSNAPAVRFRKVINLQEPGNARVNITCDNGYELSVNGVLIGGNPDSGINFRRSGDCRSFALRKGANTIEVKGSNSAGRGGLLLWGEITLRSGRKRPIVSDESWQVVGTKDAAVSYGTMYSSPWNPLRWGIADEEEPRMPVQDLPGIVYDPWPSKTPTAWYRFDLPPGTRSMKLSMAVPCEVWVNGAREQADQDGRVVLSKPALSGGICAIKVKEQPGFRGGAVFKDAVQFECGPGKISLGSWHEKGLQTYSGMGVYSRELDLPADLIGKPLALDLGEVRGTAEVKVNGRPAGVRIWKPYRFDIGKLVRAGANRLEITVANTLGPHYSIGIPTPYVFPGLEVSGILGPVSLRY